MDTALLGLIIDSSTLIATERRSLTAAPAIASLLSRVGDTAIALSSITAY